LVDIWAFGVLAYTIIDKNPPFLKETEEETRKAIINNQVSFDSEVWHDMSTECKEFINKCLNKDPYKRPNTE
jgi:serine/threonine protein kinase